MTLRLIGTIGVALVFAMAWVGAKSLAEQVSRPKLPSEQEVRALGEARLANSQIFVVLKRDFPDDFEIVISRFTRALMSGEPGAQMRLIGRQEMEAVRARYAPALGKAADSDLKELLQTNMAMHRLVLEQGGPGICDQVFRQGPAAIPPPIVTANIGFFDRLGAGTLEVLRRAIDASSPPLAEASEEDWTKVSERMRSDGVGEADLARMSSAGTDPAARDLCPTGVKMLEAIVALDGNSGRRVRASFAKTIVVSQ